MGKALTDRTSLRIDSVTFAQVQNDDSGVLWSAEFNPLPDSDPDSADHRFVVFVRLQYLEAYGEDVASDLGHYALAVYVTCPERVDAETIKRALDGYPDGVDRVWQAVALLDYGLAARLAAVCGNNLRTLETELRRAVAGWTAMFGFMMDRPQNAIGASGWDFLSGNILGKP